MAIHRVIANVTGAATGAQAGVDMGHGYSNEKLKVQVEFGSTGNVQIEGRLSDNMSWVSLGTAITANGYAIIDFLPQIRANVVANGSTVRVEVCP